MATRYVKPTGTDSGDALTEGTAWKTVDYAVKNYTAGDTIEILAGTYNLSDTLNLTKSVTLKSKDGDTVKLYGKFYKQDGTYSDCRKQTVKTGVLNSGVPGCDKDRNKPYVYAFSNDPLIEVGASNITIKEIGLYESNGQAISSPDNVVSNITIDGVIVRDCNRAPFKLFGMKNLTVKNCDIQYGEYGLRGRPPVHCNYASCFALHNCHDVIIENNISGNHEGSAFSVDNNHKQPLCTNVVVRDNFFFDSVSASIAIHGPDGGVKAYRNVLYGTSTRFTSAEGDHGSSNLDNFDFYNNLIIDAAIRFAKQLETADGKPDLAREKELLAQDKGLIKNTRIYNNTIIQSDGSPCLYIAPGYKYIFAEGVKIVNNIFRAKTSTTTVNTTGSYDAWTQIESHGGEFDYNCWFGKVSNSVRGSNDVLGDPKLFSTNPSYYSQPEKYKLTSSSPCRNAGKNLSKASPTPVTKDFFNNVRGTAFDIGFHEYDGSEPPTTVDVDFSASVTSGTIPLTVNFTDTTTGGTIESWLWEFGDGATSTVEDPSHIYYSAGLYTVKLTVSVDGVEYSRTKINYISANTVISTLRARFSIDVDAGDAPLTVNFTDSSDGTPVTWLYDFGDGSPKANTQNTSHTYIYPGTYSPSLTVTDAAGNTSVKVKENRIVVGGTTPVIDVAFSALPVSGTKPLTVQFTNESTGPVPDSFLWTFGDGTTSTEEDPEHIYTNAGIYTVTLKLTKDGVDFTDSEVNYINVQEPTVSVEVDWTSVPSSGTAPLNVQFTDATVTTGTITAWLWTFGDGQTSPLEDPLHTYDDPGSYDVTLKVTVDGHDYSVTKAKEIVATSVPVDAQADFTADITYGLTPLTVQFTDESVTTGTITAWLWEFGDTATSPDQNPSHTYVGSGNYDVTLTITVDGSPYSKTATNYIVVGESPSGIGHVETILYGGSNDGRERTNGGVFLTNSLHYLKYDTNLVGYRFTGVNIPAGATIDAAYLHVYVKNKAYNLFNCNIIGELDEDSPAFTETDYDMSGRTMTTASIHCSDNFGSLEEARLKLTPDIKTVIQEIIDLPSWAYGNAISIFLENTGGASAETRMSAFESAGAQAAMLEIDYSTVGTSSIIHILYQMTFAT